MNKKIDNKKIGLKKRRKSAAPSAPPPERVKPSPDAGLSRQQVAARVAAGMTNRPVDPPGKTVWQIIAGNVFTYFNCIFYTLAVCLILVGSYNQLTFLVVVFANMIIGTVQELNAKRTLDRLSLDTAPRSKAVREGEVVTLPTAELVADDIVIFDSGCQICADAEIVSGEVKVNESFITGESDEITKIPGDSLTTGGFIVSGECRARLDKVGEESFLSQLTLNAKRLKRRKKQGMMRSLSRLVMVIGLILIPLGGAMYYKETVILGVTPKAAVESSSAALIGMIPEGLYLLTTVALAVSVIRLAQRRTLVHDLSCIETLARVDVLCVDKTGTITENKMTATGISPIGKYPAADAERIMRDFCGNMPADNATMKALREKYKTASFRRAETVMTFSSVTKCSGVSFGRDENYILGAPEFVVRGGYEALRQEVDRLAADGSRVLLLALCDALPVNGAEVTRVLPAAFITLTNAVRPEAADTFRYFGEQGVCVKVISGDNPKTVSEAAKKACIPGAESCIDVSSLTDAQLADAAVKYTIFGRVTPNQKRTLVRALKKSGRTVAMTGDGVNDILALKEADCSVAMASGSEVACQISQLVLLDSNFAAMPSVVAEGRRVINNIERSASLFLVKNIFSFALSLISIFALFSYPITPSQLSLVGAFTIGVPSFFLALQQNTNRVSGKFLPNVLSRAFPAALTDILVIVGVVLFTSAFGISDAESSTVAGLLFGIVGMVMLKRVCSPFNLRRSLIWWGMAVLLTLSLFVAGSFFAFTTLTFGPALVLVSLALLTPSAMDFFTHACDLAGRLGKWCSGAARELWERLRKEE